MYEVSWHSDAADLTAALHELDIAQGLVRNKRVELNQSVRAASKTGCSARTLYDFKVTAREMEEATVRYLRAVAAFHAVCQKTPIELSTELPAPSRCEVG